MSLGTPAAPSTPAAPAAPAAVAAPAVPARASSAPAPTKAACLGGPEPARASSAPAVLGKDKEEWASLTAEEQLAAETARADAAEKSAADEKRGREAAEQRARHAQMADAQSREEGAQQTANLIYGPGGTTPLKRGERSARARRYGAKSGKRGRSRPRHRLAAAAVVRGERVDLQLVS